LRGRHKLLRAQDREKATWCGGHLDVAAVFQFDPVCRPNGYGGLPQCRHRRNLRAFTLAGHGVCSCAGLSIWMPSSLAVRPSRRVVWREEYAELLQQVQTAAALDRATPNR
jgi:hypothetical protein